MIWPVVACYTITEPSLCVVSRALRRIDDPVLVAMSLLQESWDFVNTVAIQTLDPMGRVAHGDHTIRDNVGKI